MCCCTEAVWRHRRDLLSLRGRAELYCVCVGKKSEGACVSMYRRRLSETKSTCDDSARAQAKNVSHTKVKGP